MKKKYNLVRPFFIIAILLVIYIYAAYVTAIPDKIILFEGEKINISKIIGINIEEITDNERPVLARISTDQTSFNQGQTNIQVKLLNVIPLKTVVVNVIPKTTVIPSGNNIGLKLYTSGVLVVGMSEIYGEDNVSHKPFENSGIEEGDMITEINNNAIASTGDLVKVVNDSNGQKLDIKYTREGMTKQASIEAVKTSKDEYKLGLWVRDAAAGVGTVTFYEPQTGYFGALGHGIVDVDTEELLSIASGEVITTNIISIIKGEKGKPGEIKGSIIKQKTIGNILKNTNFGIYGKLTNIESFNLSENDEMEVATRDEIKKGPAKIICTLENNVKKEYDIEIKNIYKNNDSNNKSMLIKITDKELLEKTGGIIQGMSGSPVIQNGKFVGAVTHVLVNDPTVGYAVFGDIMLKQIRAVE